MMWIAEKNILKIYDIKIKDAGIYTCVAYTVTPESKKLDDTAASAIVRVYGMSNSAYLFLWTY